MTFNSNYNSNYVQQFHNAVKTSDEYYEQIYQNFINRYPYTVQVNFLGNEGTVLADLP